MQRLEVSVAVQPVYGSLGVKRLNPICHLLTLLGAHHILHVSRVRVNRYSVITQFAKLAAGEQIEVCVQPEGPATGQLKVLAYYA